MNFLNFGLDKWGDLVNKEEITIYETKNRNRSCFTLATEKLGCIVELDHKILLNPDNQLVIIDGDKYMLKLELKKGLFALLKKVNGEDKLKMEFLKICLSDVAKVEFKIRPYETVIKPMMGKIGFLGSLIEGDSELILKELKTVIHSFRNPKE